VRPLLRHLSIAARAPFRLIVPMLGYRWWRQARRLYRLWRAENFPPAPRHGRCNLSRRFALAPGRTVPRRGFPPTRESPTRRAKAQNLERRLSCHAMCAASFTKEAAGRARPICHPVAAVTVCLFPSII
jgi:hypothetical protein